MASCVKDLGLKVETLEEPLHVSSPLGTRVSYKICQDCELDISGILLTVDLQVMDMSEFDVILRTKSSLIVIVRGLLPTHQIMFELCFKGISTMIYPMSSKTLDGIGI